MWVLRIEHSETWWFSRFRSWNRFFFLPLGSSHRYDFTFWKCLESFAVCVNADHPRYNILLHGFMPYHGSAAFPFRPRKSENNNRQYDGKCIRYIILLLLLYAPDAFNGYWCTRTIIMYYYKMMRTVRNTQSDRTIRGRTDGSVSAQQPLDES